MIKFTISQNLKFMGQLVIYNRIRGIYNKKEEEDKQKPLKKDLYSTI